MEFKKCILSTSINGRYETVDSLSEQLKYMETLETKIIQPCNRKLNEISSSRVIIIGLVISVSALFTSIVSLYLSLIK